MAGSENIPNQAIGFSQVQPSTLTRHNARRILTAVLQYR